MTSPDPQPWFVSFLEAYVCDVRAGREPDIRRYDALFPGHEAAIREELSRLRDADSESELSQAVGREVVGPYTIREELGRGGQGVVYLAEDPRLGRPVALKILRSEFGLDASALKRFQRESVAVSRLDDPGLCTVYDSGVDDGVHYIAMRYVEGESLRDVIRKRREGREPSETSPPEREDRGSSIRGSRGEIEEVVELFVQCARSLHVAHEAGVVHRDIKPGNIVVTPNGRPVILDFGLARLDREGLETLTDSGDLMGTPGYMAPEQVLGRLGAIDARTDIYSLGVALYESLVGVRPIQAPTRAELYSAIVRRDPVSMRAHLASIPRDLDVVVQRALEKDRARRYETAADFADDLERFLQRRPVLARPVGPGRRLLRFYERSPVVAWSLTAALIGLIATTASWLRSEENRRWAERENAEYERLADARRHAELVAEAAELWPARSHLVPAMEDWLRRARALAARAPEHRAALERLRRRGRSVSTRGPAVRAPIEKGVIEQELRWTRAGVAHAERLRRQALRLEGEGDRDRRLEVIEDHAGRLEYRAEVLEDLLGEPSASSPLTRVWSFDDLAVGWRHDQLEGLVRAVESLVGGVGAATISGMEQRVRDAGRVARESIFEHREAWDRAATAVAQDDRFGDFVLEPIAGLIPLGADPESGFEEFAVWGTGRIPSRQGGDGALLSDRETAMVLVLLCGGRVTIGASRREVMSLPDELPVPVRLRPFLVGKYEVTQEHWRQVMGSVPSHYRPPHALDNEEIVITEAHPVESVTWFEAVEFARRLGLELPTEAQWEYAARAGGRGTFDHGDDAGGLEGTNLYDSSGRGLLIMDSAPEFAWSDGHPVHGPVQAFRANAFGLHSMQGNVSEWCADAYAIHRGYGRDAGDGMNVIPGNPGRRVVRGGAFNSGVAMARCAQRRPREARGRFQYVGLRVVCRP